MSGREGLTATNRDRPSLRPTERALLWFGVLGGVCAWGISLILTSYFGSIACRGNIRGLDLLGISGVKVLDFLGSMAMALLTLVAAFASWWIWRQTGSPDQETVTPGMGRAPFWALGGIFLNALFFFAIILTTIATLAVAQTCS